MQVTAQEVLIQSLKIWFWFEGSEALHAGCEVVESLSLGMSRIQQIKALSNLM